ncbi:MAG: hypothetical protein N3D10_00960 [Candidatus Micrarchaeota archaeon]|nr:hypothetical protein [Candidatus Micrarchaeota archaeon]
MKNMLTLSPCSKELTKLIKSTSQYFKYHKMSGLYLNVANATNTFFSSNFNKEEKILAKHLFSCFIYSTLVNKYKISKEILQNTNLWVNFSNGSIFLYAIKSKENHPKLGDYYFIVPIIDENPKAYGHYCVFSDEIFVVLNRLPQYFSSEKYQKFAKKFSFSEILDGAILHEQNHRVFSYQLDPIFRYLYLLVDEKTLNNFDFLCRELYEFYAYIANAKYSVEQTALTALYLSEYKSSGNIHRCALERLFNYLSCSINGSSKKTAQNLESCLLKLSEKLSLSKKELNHLEESFGLLAFKKDFLRLFGLNYFINLEKELQIALNNLSAFISKHFDYLEDFKDELGQNLSKILNSLKKLNNLFNF